MSGVKDRAGVVTVAIMQIFRSAVSEAFARGKMRPIEQHIENLLRDEFEDHAQEATKQGR